MTSSTSTRRAILILDHGTRNETARQVFVRLANEIAGARPDWLVGHAHMELATPHFDAALDELVERGASHVYVHLHFLGAGYHVRESIPELVTGARERHPSIVIEVSEPLGHEPGITHLVLDRMDRQTRDERQSSKE